MYIMSKHFNNRAVSQVIAALLLIAIAVAAAILLYVFSIGLLGSLSSSGGQQTREQVIMEAYTFQVGGPLAIALRNVGSASVDVANADYFINGVAATPTGCGASLAPGGSCQASLTLASYASLMFGAGYAVKVVTPTGGVFSYSVIYGSSG